MKNCIWISPKGSGVSHSRIYYFKKSFELDKIGEGVVEISAQSRYRLYINGELQENISYGYYMEATLSDGTKVNVALGKWSAHFTFSNGHPPLDV